MGIDIQGEGCVGMWWILERLENERFPYRVKIKKSDSTLLCLQTQDRWPGPKGNVFCLRGADENLEKAPAEELERVPVVSLNRYGKRLAVVLDRSRNKRCDFLFLKKRYKNREGEYEQIFWRTQKALTDRRPGVKLTARGDLWLEVAIDQNERYPWNLAGCTVRRENLPVGDYALTDREGILAVVERKTLDNLLHDIGNMASLHQSLGELEAFENSAVVIEAQYADFLKRERVAPYTPSFASKAIAELFAFHSRLPIVFAGNRKMAIEWTLRYFRAVRSHNTDAPDPTVREAAAAYRIQPSFRGGTYYEALSGILEMPGHFTMQMLRDHFLHIPERTLRRALSELKRQKKITCHRAGRRSYWEILDR